MRIKYVEAAIVYAFDCAIALFKTLVLRYHGHLNRFPCSMCFPQRFRFRIGIYSECYWYYVSLIDPFLGGLILTHATVK